MFSSIIFLLVTILVFPKQSLKVRQHSLNFWVRLMRKEYSLNIDINLEYLKGDSLSKSLSLNVGAAAFCWDPEGLPFHSSPGGDPSSKLLPSRLQNNWQGLLSPFSRAVFLVTPICFHFSTSVVVCVGNQGLNFTVACTKLRSCCPGYLFLRSEQTSQ